MWIVFHSSAHQTKQYLVYSVTLKQVWIMKTFTWEKNAQIQCIPCCHPMLPKHNAYQCDRCIFQRQWASCINILLFLYSECSKSESPNSLYWKNSPLIACFSLMNATCSLGGARSLSTGYKEEFHTAELQVLLSETSRQPDFILLLLFLIKSYSNSKFI